MPGFVPAGRDPVTIDVEDRWRKDAKPRQPAFFPGLAERDPQQVFLPVSVPTELEPLIKLVVMGEQRSPAVRTDDPSRAGKVAGNAGSKQSIRMRFRKTNNLGRHCGLVRIEVAGGMGPEQFKDRL